MFGKVLPGDDHETRMLKEHARLVRYTIRRYNYSPPKSATYDDLFQIGCLGLLKAIRGHKPDKIAFSTYAIYKIRAEIGKAHKYDYRASRNFTVISMDKRMPLRGQKVETYKENFRDWATTEDRVQQRETLNTLLRARPQVVKLYVLGYTQAEIAEKMGVTQVTIHRWLQKAKQAVTT